MGFQESVGQGAIPKPDAASWPLKTSSMVGERSPGEEGESRGLLERGEVRIPE